MYILFPQCENINKFKHLQFMAGVRASTYWLSCYIFDFLIFGPLNTFIIYLGIAVLPNLFQDQNEMVYNGVNELGKVPQFSVHKK